MHGPGLWRVREPSKFPGGPIAGVRHGPVPAAYVGGLAIATNPAVQYVRFQAKVMRLRLVEDDYLGNRFVRICF